MALSKQDQEFYEEKLNYKAIYYLFGYTCVVGAIAAPSLMFLADWSAGQGGTWTFSMVEKVAVIGGLLGSVVAVVMYLAFKFLLQMGWLPSRR